MLGAVIGDLAGSRFERAAMLKGEKVESVWGFELLTPECRVTDDSVLSFAVARALRESGGELSLLGEACVDALHEFGSRYPDAGYGGSFIRWALSRSREPYGSWGNGSAMRVSPVGWAYSRLEETLEAARISAAVTPRHPFGVAGAQAVALAIFMARRGSSKEEIREAAARLAGYDLDRGLEELRPGYRFDVSCQGSVPESILAFLESGSLVEAVRRAVWLGGDTDTQGAIAGSMAEALFGVPKELEERALAYLDDFLRSELALWRAWLEGRRTCWARS